MTKQRLTLSIEETLNQLKKLNILSLKKIQIYLLYLKDYIKAIVKNRNVLKAIKDMNK